MNAFPIPSELVSALTGPTGLAAIVRAKLAGAVFRPIAHISVRNGRYVAEINFKERLGPEQRGGLLVTLTILPGSEA